jgi:hypothetical protein
MTTYYGWKTSSTPLPRSGETRSLYGFEASIAGGIRLPIWPSIAFPTIVIGQYYSVIFDLYPATTPVTYALAPGSGSLPSGISLSNVGTGTAQGQLSGTCTASPASYPITIRATGYGGAIADKSFTLQVASVGGGGKAWAWSG